MSTQTFLHFKPYRAKSLQLSIAAPIALIWLALATLSVVWWAGLIIATGLGTAGGPHWTKPYLMVVCTLAIAMAAMEAVFFHRATQGRSRLWHHFAMFSAAFVIVAMIAIVGD
ncbi:MAG: hypothetical protein SGI88_08150 [Candidatus Hydrogenedentes bacterium]|nr:hypothetical protein [Candidatus Hydrogenedentota bacterium]